MRTALEEEEGEELNAGGACGAKSLGEGRVRTFRSRRYVGLQGPLIVDICSCTLISFQRYDPIKLKKPPKGNGKIKFNVFFFLNKILSMVTVFKNSSHHYFVLYFV